jgi:nitroimidazol reductase NimA-like FMN-containing flavoprotein (pyridoxamine 5'-phosphate oxidase superfamily)
MDPDAAALLDRDVPAHLGTIDGQGYPRITPIWFVYEDGAFYMSSLVGKRHIPDLRREPRPSVRVDCEEPTSVGGVRANRQVGGRGIAELRTDVGAPGRRVSP